MKSSANVGTIPPVRCNCAQIRRAARKVTRFYDTCLAPVGVTASQFTLLAYLKHQGPMRMSQLAGLLAMDRATLGHNLRPLERDGLLEIIPSKEDRRARLAAIIAAGLHRGDASVPDSVHALKRFPAFDAEGEAADILLGNRLPTSKPVLDPNPISKTRSGSSGRRRTVRAGTGESA